MGYRGDANGLQNPRTNVYYAAKYLRYQIDRYGSVPRGIVAYNRGNARGLTRSRYSDKVINHWQESIDVQKRRLAEVR
jgi:soluble lytic murein transglycosylase-like protein